MSKPLLLVLALLWGAMLWGALSQPVTKQSEEESPSLTLPASTSAPFPEPIKLDAEPLTSFRFKGIYMGMKADEFDAAIKSAAKANGYTISTKIIDAYDSHLPEHERGMKKILIDPAEIIVPRLYESSATMDNKGCLVAIELTPESIIKLFNSATVQPDEFISEFINSYNIDGNRIYCRVEERPAHSHEFKFGREVFEISKIFEGVRIKWNLNPDPKKITFD